MGTIKTTNIEPIADNGTVTLGSSGDTFTVPSGVTVNMSNATQTGVGGTNTPAFEAYTNGLQSITENTFVKMTMATEVYDTDNCFDNSTNYRFTPTVAGKYYVYGKAYTDPSSYNNDRSSDMYIYKNGSQVVPTQSNIMTGGNSSSEGATATTHNCSCVVDMNGTSDYVELYLRLNTWNDSGAQAGSKQFGAYRILT